MNTQHSLLLLLSCLLLCSCSTIKKTDCWHDDTHMVMPIKSAVLIGVASNSTSRRIYEDSLVEAFNKVGVSTIPSYSLIDDPKKVNKESLPRALKGKDVDVYVVTKLLKEKDVTRYHPPTPTTNSYIWGHYGYVSTYAYNPGYYSSHTKYYLETTLFDGKTGKLIWSMNTETSKPESAKEGSDGLNELIIEELAKLGYVTLPQE